MLTVHLYMRVRISQILKWATGVSITAQPGLTIFNRPGRKQLGYGHRSTESRINLDSSGQKHSINDDRDVNAAYLVTVRQHDCDK